MISAGLNRFPQISSFYIPLFWGGVLLLVMVWDTVTESKKSGADLKDFIFSKLNIRIKKEA